MTAVEQLLVAWLLNLSWQAPLVVVLAGVVIKTLRNRPARVHHQIWLLSIGTITTLPAGSLLGLWGSVTTAPFGREPPLWSQQPMRAFLVVAAVAILIRTTAVIRAALESRRLRREATLVSTEDLTGDMIPFPRGGAWSNLQVMASPSDASTLGPMTVGVLHPAILMPGCLLSSTDRNTLRAVLAHEMAHVCRGDMWWSTVAEVLLIPLAFHPVAAVLRRRLIETRELACDEFVVEGGFRSTDYAQALLDVTRLVTDSPRALNPLGVSGGAVLEQRIRALAAWRGTRDLRLNTWQRILMGIGTTLILAPLLLSARSVYEWLTSVPTPNFSFGPLPAPPPPPPKDSQNHRRD